MNDVSRGAGAERRCAKSSNNLALKLSIGMGLGPTYA